MLTRVWTRRSGMFRSSKRPVDEAVAIPELEWEVRGFSFVVEDAVGESRNAAFNVEAYVTKENLHPGAYAPQTALARGPRVREANVGTPPQAPSWSARPQDPVLRVAPRHIHKAAPCSPRESARQCSLVRLHAETPRHVKSCVGCPKEASCICAHTSYPSHKELGNLARSAGS